MNNKISLKNVEIVHSVLYQIWSVKLFQFLLFSALFNTTPFHIDTSGITNILYEQYATWDNVAQLWGIKTGIKDQTYKFRAIFWGCFQGNHQNFYWSTCHNGNRFVQVLMKLSQTRSSFPYIECGSQSLPKQQNQIFLGKRKLTKAKTNE